MTTERLAAAGLRVKPLKWVRSTPTGWRDNVHTEPLRYVVRGPFPDGHFIWCSVGEEWMPFQSVPSVEAAKAAAQADYEARILAALEEVK